MFFINNLFNVKPFKRIMAVIFFSFIFFISKEILVFSEEIILLVAFSIMFVIFTLVGWSALESMLMTRANEIFFILDDLYDLKIKKLHGLRKVRVNKKFYFGKLSKVSFTIQINLLRLRFLSIILEDIFFLFTYPYLILKEIVIKEFLFLKLFLSKKIVLKEVINVNFGNYIVSNSNLNLNLNFLDVDYTSYCNEKQLACLGFESITTDALETSFGVEINRLSPQINTIFLKNLSINSFSNFTTINLNLQGRNYLNFLIFNFWDLGLLKLDFYYNSLINSYKILYINRISNFYFKNKNVASVNFNSFLKLLNDSKALGFDFELYLFKAYFIQKFIQHNFISPNFCAMYFYTFFK